MQDVTLLPRDPATVLLTERLGGQWLPESLDEVRSVFSLHAPDQEVDL